MLSTTNKCLIVLFAMCKNFQIYVEKKNKTFKSNLFDLMNEKWMDVLSAMELLLVIHKFVSVISSSRRLCLQKIK